MRTSLFVLAFAFVLFSPAYGAHAASLTLGSSGAGVTALQQLLIEKGYLAAGKATGYFGPLTDAALKKFQCDAKILCSGSRALGYGVYGPRTQAALKGSTATPTTPTPAPSTTPTSSSSFEYSGWIPYWREEAGVKDALQNIESLDEINPFVYVVQKDGTISDMVGIADEPWKSLRTISAAKKIRFIPTVMWSDSDAMHRIISNSVTRSALVDEIVSLTIREGFDGIDIDFEGKIAEDKDYYSLFHKELYKKMGKKWVMCTIESRTPLSDRYYNTTTPAGAGQYANDFAVMNANCDRVRFMTYDQQTIDLKRASEADAAGKLYAPVADVAWVEKAIKEAMKSVDPKKIVVGVATYGYEWEVTAYADGYTYDLLWSFGPGYATPIAAQYGITPERQFSGEMGFSYTPSNALSTPPAGAVDLTSKAPSGTTSANMTAAGALAAAQANNTNHTFRYMVWQDAEAIRQKIDMAKRLGVRGVAVFRIDGGEDAGMWQYFK